MLLWFFEFFGFHRCFFGCVVVVALLFFFYRWFSIVCQDTPLSCRSLGARRILTHNGKPFVKQKPKQQRSRTQKNTGKTKKKAATITHPKKTKDMPACRNAGMDCLPLPPCRHAGLPAWISGMPAWIAGMNCRHAGMDCRHELLA